MTHAPSRPPVLARTAATLAALLLARRWALRWGATPAEVDAPLPGDEVLPRPDLSSTRAITIRTSAHEVWPWLAQMGQGRGGLYSYDALENLVGCEIHSADEIVPEWQDVAVGDAVRVHPEVALTVVQVEPDHALVLQGAVPVTGAADDSAGPPPPYDFTWAFVLRPHPEGCRLVVRERYSYLTPWAGLMVEPVEWVSFLMSQRMLRGIRDRAERAAGRTGVPL